MKNKNFNKRSLILWIVALLTLFTALGAVFAIAVTDTTRPTIVSVSPMNNELGVATHKAIMVQFSEPMNSSTINENTFTIVQRSTPPNGSLSSEYRSLQLNGAVYYNGLEATFVPDTVGRGNPMQPNQEFGNVFTATITTGATDLAGNSLSQDYTWSFGTGNEQFYTDNSTSQLNQSSAPIIAPIAPEVIPPSTQPPVTTAPATVTQVTTSTIPWAFIGGAAFLLLIIALVIFSFVTRPASQRNTISSSSRTSIRTSRPNPFGDVHPVADIEGIGPKYSKGLNAIGIKNTKQLWNANPAKVARATGALVGVVKSWQHMAELASVKDIGPQYAELLERSGVHSIDQLKNYNATELLSMVREKENSLKINIQGNTPGPALVENWIAEARDHTFTNPEEGQTA